MDIIAKIYEHEPWLATDIIRLLELTDLAKCQVVSKDWREICDRLPTALRDAVKKKQKIESYFKRTFSFGII